MKKISIGDIVKPEFGTAVFTYTDQEITRCCNHSLYGIVTDNKANPESGINDIDVTFVFDGSKHKYKEEDLAIICSTNLKNTVIEKVTLERIKDEYHTNDLCMGELLASFAADGLNLEEAFEMYLEAKKWADGDKFFRMIDDNEILEEL